MARSRILTSSTSVSHDRGHVVLTTTPGRAVALAVSIQHSNAGHVDWLDDVVGELFTAARIAAAPGVTRGSFLRGAWLATAPEVADTERGEVAQVMHDLSVVTELPVDSLDPRYPTTSPGVAAALARAEETRAAAVTAATAVVAQAVAIATAAQTDLTAEMQAGVDAQAVLTTRDAVLAAARRTADAAERARRG
jgi:hypothetical protein